MADRATLRAFMERVLDDRSLSRSERQCLAALLADGEPSPPELAALQADLFALAASRLRHPDDRAVLDTVAEMLKALRPFAAAPPTASEALFFPSAESLARFVALLRSCRRSLDVCVFTVTENQIADALRDLHRRGVSVRVIADDDKSLDLGSDCEYLRSAGIPVCYDASPAHMHHKFALLDDDRLLTGSFNWTRGAAAENRENVLVTSDPALLAAYRAEFDRLWAEFGR